jgi:hypothetical protein
MIVASRSKKAVLNIGSAETELASRSMQMGTLRLPQPYDAAARHTLQWEVCDDLLS